MKIYEALNYAKGKLSNIIKNKGRAYSEAEALMLFTLKVTREELYMHFHDVLGKKKFAEYKKTINLRLKHIPMQYITRESYFYSRDFFIQRGVFIPRPETETVIEAVKYLKSKLCKNASAADIGTGSGIIAVTLLCEIPEIETMHAFDISVKAINTAKPNAKKYNCFGRIKFIKNDFFGFINKHKTKYDIVLSNPPYISLKDMKKLEDEVLIEPHSALTDKKDGLSFYTKFMKYAKIFLKNEGYLVFEIGDNTAQRIKEIFSNEAWSFIKILNDFNDKERVMIYRYDGEEND